MLAGPVLGVEDDAVAVVAGRQEAAERRLPLAMPLQHHQARHAGGSGGADVPFDQVQGEVVPRGDAAGHHERATAAEDEDVVEPQPDLRVAAAEGGGEGPVDRRLAAVEQPRLGEEEDTGASGAERRALPVHPAQPVDERGGAAWDPVGAVEHHQRNDGDVGRRDLGAGAVRKAGRGRAGALGHDADLEGVRRHVGVDAGEEREGRQRLVEAAQRGELGVAGDGEADADRVGHRAFVADTDRRWRVWTSMEWIATCRVWASQETGETSWLPN